MAFTTTCTQKSSRIVLIVEEPREPGAKSLVYVWWGEGDAGAMTTWEVVESKEDWCHLMVWGTEDLWLPMRKVEKLLQMVIWSKGE